MEDRDPFGERAANEHEGDAHLALNVCAMVALFAGATCSLLCTLYAGRHNLSVLLAAMFAGWVLAPFAGLYAVNAASRRRPARSRAALHVATLIVSLSSAIIYAIAAQGSPSHRTTFLFLVMPLFSWVVIAVDYAIASRRK